MSQEILDRFYTAASETTRGAELGPPQGGDYTPETLRVELNNTAAKQVPQWSAFESPYVPDSPTMDGIRTIIDNCVTAFEKYLADGKPGLPPWPRESSAK